MAREPVNNKRVLILTYGQRVGLGVQKEYRILCITGTGSLDTAKKRKGKNYWPGKKVTEGSQQLIKRINALLLLP